MMSMLKKHGAASTFTPAEVDLLDQLVDSSEHLLFLKDWLGKMGLVITWNGAATNNPIFAEILLEKPRTRLFFREYALDVSTGRCEGDDILGVGQVGGVP
ncbi:hypothetical protein SOVF_170000 isoform A [Spinacia oleracea]|nr:hypothetical protein SOVF_170000 isoform A [Spinacia oleracea]